MPNFGETIFGFNPATGTPMSVLTSDIIYSAFRIAGILHGPLRGISTEESLEGLDCFNTVVDSYNSQRYLVLSISRKVFDVVAGQQEYELGPSAADWITDRPPKLEDASYISLQDPSMPLEIPLAVLTFDQWQLIPQKSITSTWPQGIWYDPSQVSLPNAKALIWPVPSIAGQIALYGWSQIAQSVTASTALLLAPGYKASLQYDLAIELCPRWNRPVPPDVRLAAIQYKAQIKSVNVPTLDLRCDRALLGNQGWFDYRTGGFGTRGGF